MDRTERSREPACPHSYPARAGSNEARTAPTSPQRPGGDVRRNSAGHEAVPDASGGDDQLRIVRVILDLEPEPTDVRVDETGVAEVLVAPHPLEQLIARQDRAGMIGELAHQPELGLGAIEL